jgi:hypothetical protein
MTAAFRAAFTGLARELNGLQPSTLTLMAPSETHHDPDQLERSYGEAQPIQQRQWSERDSAASWT